MHLSRPLAALLVVSLLALAGYAVPALAIDSDPVNLRGCRGRGGLGDPVTISGPARLCRCSLSGGGGPVRSFVEVPR